MTHRKFLLFVASVLALFVSSQVTWADPPDHVNLPNQAAANHNQNDEESPAMNQLAQNNAKHECKYKPGMRSGLIKTNKHVYYCDEDILSLSVVLPHSLQAYWEGDADAHIVIQIPVDASSDNLAMFPLKLDPPPVHPEGSEEHQQHIIQNFDLTEHGLTCESLEGDYQIALILTKPAMDPLKVEDWYDGFQGLIATSRICFSVSENEDDADHDGNFDGDYDGDGFTD
ncbi:MAG: hypothetical protein AVO38_09690 [delta proteobacterium ML8_D]|jgi:hypothetical protein|nr:MAG: hypothetical protein AVO38_09690 [delta proteobacterium ML8_D]